MTISHTRRCAEQTISTWLADAYPSDTGISEIRKQAIDLIRFMQARGLEIRLTDA